MHAAHLTHLFRRLLATTLPLAAACAAIATPACLTCPNRTEYETRNINQLPSGWSYASDGSGLLDPNGVIHTPENNDLPCGSFCGGDTQSCSLQRCSFSNGDDGQGGSGEGGEGGSHHISSDCLESSADFIVGCTRSVPDSCGRRPPGLRPRRRKASESALACYFARAAHLEAASVDAFELLASELATHGAPLSLRRAVRRSAHDERRHARTMAALARRAGATVRKPVVQRPPTARPLLEIALENAREGNISETYGVLAAMWQSQHAKTRRLRVTFAMIARDEARHAALSWRIANWADQQLSPHEREAVASARELAAQELLSGLGAMPAASLSQVGLPPATVATALLTGMLRELCQRVPLIPPMPGPALQISA